MRNVGMRLRDGSMLRKKSTNQDSGKMAARAISECEKLRHCLLRSQLALHYLYPPILRLNYVSSISGSLHRIHASKPRHASFVGDIIRPRAIRISKEKERTISETPLTLDTEKTTMTRPDIRPHHGLASYQTWG